MRRRRIGVPARFHGRALHQIDDTAELGLDRLLEIGKAHEVVHHLRRQGHQEVRIATRRIEVRTTPAGPNTSSHSTPKRRQRAAS
jgi:hypothetical protein